MYVINICGYIPIQYLYSASFNPSTRTETLEWHQIQCTFQTQPSSRKSPGVLSKNSCHVGLDVPPVCVGQVRYGYRRTSFNCMV